MAAIRQAMRRFMPATWTKSGALESVAEQKVVLGEYYNALTSTGLYSTHRTRPWPVERAVVEAYERVVWIYKSVEAISSAASQLNFQLKKGEELVEDHPLYRVLNKRANPLETGRQFRKRLSAQILLSKRGAFVEITRSRGGEILRLDLLPPGRTVPVPGDGKELVKHYEVLRVDGSRYEIDPERVRWFREPHPLDPYSGVTPLEAAGMSVELDYFTRLYNVAWLKNDARPGGVLAVDGVMGDEEMNRVERRFAKGAPNAGSLAVIQGQVSYVDLATQPRDMHYETLSSISKREILIAFGVPESVIGDASGRTWDNAEQENYNFWSVTMPPHLDMLATGLDDDFEDDLEGGFDTSKIEVLQRPLLARRAEAREEFDKGLICINEYRELAGYEPLDVVHSRSLYLPSGRTEIPASEADAKEIEKKAQAAQQAQAALPAAPKEPEPTQKPSGVASGAKAPGVVVPLQRRSEQRREAVGEGKILRALPEGGQPAPRHLRPTIRLVRPVETKAEREPRPRTQVRESEEDEAAHDRLEASLEAALASLMVRLTARTASRLTSPKSRKNTRHWQPESPSDMRVGTKALDVDQAVDAARWEEEAEQAVSPLVQAAALAAAAGLMGDLSEGAGEAGASLVAGLVASVSRMVRLSAGKMAARLAQTLREADQAGRAVGEMAALARSYAEQATSWARAVAVQAATATVSGAREVAARAVADREPGSEVVRYWRTRNDSAVRRSHRGANGQKRALGEPFEVGEALLRYPGDEEGPPAETYRCRCRLTYRSTVTGRFVPAPPGEITKSPHQAEKTEAMLTLTLKHLPGRHAQSTHGRGWQSNRSRDARGRFSRTGSDRSARPRPAAEPAQSGYQKAVKSALVEWFGDDDLTFGPERTAWESHDPQLLEIWRRQGFADKPETGDEVRLQEEIAAGGIEVWRGMTGEDGMKHAQQFLTGDEPFPGLGIYANGTYTSTERDIAVGYARDVGKLSYGAREKKGGGMIRAVVRQNARIISMEDLKEVSQNAQQEFLRVLMDSPGPGSEEFQRLLPLTQVLNDPGRVASLMGYDAIVHRFPGVDDEYVILNRTAVIVQPDAIEVAPA